MPDTKRPWPQRIGPLALKRSDRWEAVYTTPGAEYTHDPEQYGDPRYAIGGDYDNDDPVRVLRIECEEVHVTDEDGYWQSYRGDKWTVADTYNSGTAQSFRDAVRTAKQFVNPQP